MTATYKLHTDELTEDILEAIKKAFKKREVYITITDEDMDETAWLFSSEANKARLIGAVNDLEEGRGVRMTMEELQENFGA